MTDDAAPTSPREDPVWYKDAIIYQTHVKAFSDTNGDGTGDFRGLTEKLPYIRDLGVNTIWLLPFYPSPMRDDGYDIADYLGIHPAYGTLDDFRGFVGEAHRLGLRIITELVINHTSDQHPWFQAARSAPRGSSERDFYVWSDDDRRFAETRIIFTDTESSNWAWDPVAKQYYWHRFFSHQPDLNHNNPHVVQAVIRVMRFWLDLGVDGLRLDAIPYLCVRDGTSNENLPETHAVIRQMRAVVDAHYQDRMFLAEANQWPEDVREYFGDGDECHVAYHFPLMPRMYMALAQEDRYPIVEIMEQTPDIPERCQWAIFLRNHDELTLEMVSDRERDYMYDTYAADPRMRINVGIRRRLATLLDNDQDKIRLMHSLLLSMPGSPILYYGDELGMGDNIYLGDRNGVRTPMQWSPDRNAGFSRADPQRLYLPPVMDPVHGYEAVNVEAQLRNPASLLNWMRRIIAVRQQHQVFGRGALSFLDPGNRRILAYVRAGEGEAVLCVANLSRAAQPVELDLARFQGRVPVEMLGRNAFPPIGELPYLLTLPGYGFYWLLLSREADAPSWHEEHAPSRKLATLVLPEGWRSLQPARASRLEPAMRALQALEQRVLPAYLPTRRWFGGKGDGIRSVRLVECQEWRDWLLTLVEVTLEDGSTQRYFLPLTVFWEGRDGARMVGQAGAATLAKVRRQALPGVLCDAMVDEAFLQAVAGAIAASGQGAEAPFGQGRLVFTPTKALGELMDGDLPLGVRMPPEGSNSGAILGDRLFLKAYRRLHEGVNPEVELGRLLTAAPERPQIVPLAGVVSVERPGDASVSLAILQAFVPSQGDLWGFTLHLLERLCEARDAENADGWERDPAQIGYAVLMETFGRRLAQLHLALARSSDDPTLAAEPIDRADLTAWQRQIEREALETMDMLAERCPILDADARALGERLLERRAALLAAVGRWIPKTAIGVKTRVHGDLHLGQVLVVGDDVVIIDFEGEPARDLATRRAKRSPLVDVAGVLRSLDYAAAQAARQLAFAAATPPEPLIARLRAWSRSMSTRFVRAYEAAAAETTIGSITTQDGSGLLDALTLQKALYEIRYELRSRPQWADTPIGGVLALLDV